MPRGGPGYIMFRDGPRVPYDQPLNTLDPRYLHCVDHRTACVCREAEWSEEANEWRLEFYGVRKLIAGDILAGHSVDVCMCTGCQLVRELHLSHLVRNVPKDNVPF